MIAADNPFSTLADGSALPVEYAIASGNIGLMYECLQDLQADFDSGELSAAEQGAIALDMIDLLAVLSQVIIVLTSYLLDEIPPDSLTVEDLFASSDVQVLSQIGDEDLMAYGIESDPSPLQLLWGVIGIAAFYYLSDAETFPDNIPVGVKDNMRSWFDDAETQAVSVDNDSFISVLDHISILYDL